jgi:hypothetical protein
MPRSSGASRRKQILIAASALTVAFFVSVVPARTGDAASAAALEAVPRTQPCAPARPCQMSQPASPSATLYANDSPDGRMAVAARVGSGAGIEIEPADDFIANGTWGVSSATFTGLMASGASMNRKTDSTCI